MKLSEIRTLTRNIPHAAGAAQKKKILEQVKALGLDPGGLYQELEMDSRFVDIHRDVSDSNDRVALHSHAFYELLYCRNTCGAEYLVESDRYRLQKGDIVLIPPGFSHRPLLPEPMDEPYQRDVLWISGEFAEILRRSFPDSDRDFWESPGLLRTAGTKWEYLGEHFRWGVLEAEKRDLGWEMAVLGDTMAILTGLIRIYRDGKAPSLKAEKPELLDRVMAYVETHLADRITVGEIARQFYVSESTVSQTFRKKMGVSFYRCVTQRRLIAAKELIARGVTLEAVGRQVGFADYSTFYRAFRQEYGISPRQYRKLRDNGEQP